MHELRNLGNWSDNDKVWFAEAYALTQLLSRCVIIRGYRISPSWFAAITFTGSGQKLISKLREKRTNENDAKMSVFLQLFAGNTLLVDPDTKTENLRAMLSNEITRGRISFPYIWGRQLADVAHQLFPDKDKLNELETSKLLASTPAGVFQEGSTTVGPLGAFTSRQRRALAAPGHSFPGYLCSDSKCRAIHRVSITTGHSSIHNSQKKLAEIVERDYPADSNVTRIVGKFLRETFGLYSDNRSTDIFNIISDNYDDEEFEALLTEMVRAGCENNLRNEMQNQWSTIIKSPSDVAPGRSRATQEHMLLFFTDSEIVRAIDRIEISKTATAGITPRTSFNRRFPPGEFILKAQIGKFGLRFVDPEAAKFYRNSYSLISRMYLKDGATQTRDDLAYALQCAPKDAEAALIDRLGEFTPQATIEKLVLNTRSGSEFAQNTFGLDNLSALDRKSLTDALSWKLGAPDMYHRSALTDLQEAASNLRKSNEKSAPMLEIRGLANHVFTLLEEVLQRALIYSSWAFLTDHYLSKNRFSFEVESKIDVLNELSVAKILGNPGRMSNDGKNTLGPLGSEFGRLASALEKVEQDEENWLRPDSEVPSESLFGSKPFALRSKLFFLNLHSAIRAKIVSDLRSISAKSQDPALIDLRNDTSHGNNEFPNQNKFFEGLVIVESLVELFLQSGLFPTLFELEEKRIDFYGRGSVTMRGLSTTVELRFPVFESAPGFPRTERRQFVMPNYELRTLGPIRFLVGSPPPRSGYWTNWPPRRTSRVTDRIGHDLTSIGDEDREQDVGVS
ncbi:hypothetical protein [Rhodococcoides fascians]|nr:hypothetical protein [Rhodococcus fascians]